MLDPPGEHPGAGPAELRSGDALAPGQPQVRRAAEGLGGAREVSVSAGG